MAEKIRFSPSICLTHDCNLSCIYCYQSHCVGNVMSFDTAKRCIDTIFSSIPVECSGVEIGFIGGEPLLEFELIKQIVDYVASKNFPDEYIFFASTNGTLLTEEMKSWFKEHKDRFVLGLSLDGTPETHNYNRCDSYGSIDFDFFINTWPNQGVKMTLSEHSLANLAANIKHIHSLGFKQISGVNLFEGTFDWGQERFIDMLLPQLTELVEFYVENDDLTINQMLDRRLILCEEKPRKKRKWCGIGKGTLFFDTDGSIMPCAFCTPMTFDVSTISRIRQTDFSVDNDFIDDECFNECYMYPICPYCAGANYLTEGTFKTRSKKKCKIQKLITLYSAELQARRMVKNPDRFSDAEKYNLINAIKKIRKHYLPEFVDIIEKASQ